MRVTGGQVPCHIFFVAKADEKDDDKKEPIYDGFWDF